MARKNEKKRGGVQFSEDHQPSNESKKVKKGKTILKEKMGLTSWERMQDYMTGKGVDRFIVEHAALEGKEYCDIYLAAAEFFKPKLSRVDNAFPDSEEVEIIRIRSKQKIEAKN